MPCKDSKEKGEVAEGICFIICFIYLSIPFGRNFIFYALLMYEVCQHGCLCSSVKYWSICVLVHNLNMSSSISKEKKKIYEKLMGDPSVYTYEDDLKSTLASHVPMLHAYGISPAFIKFDPP